MKNNKYSRIINAFNFRHVTYSFQFELKEENFEFWMVRMAIRWTATVGLLTLSISEIDAE